MKSPQLSQLSPVSPDDAQFHHKHLCRNAQERVSFSCTKMVPHCRALDRNCVLIPQKWKHQNAALSKQLAFCCVCSVHHFDCTWSISALTSTCQLISSCHLRSTRHTHQFFTRHLSSSDEKRGEKCFLISHSQCLFAGIICSVLWCQSSGILLKCWYIMLATDPHFLMHHHAIHCLSSLA